MAPPSRRTYTWNGDNLIITFNITDTSNPISSKLIPPIAWLTSSGTTVKVWHNRGLSYDERQRIRSLNNNECYNYTGIDDIFKNIIEISVPKFKIEKATSCLHQQGFSNEDIYRMLDKGPWVLAFDFQKSIPKLVDDLKVINSQMILTIFLSLIFLFFLLLLIIDIFYHTINEM